MPTTLRDLLRDVPGVLSVRGDADITAPVAESDADVQPGGVFVARRGLSADGHAFIPRAVERGAAAVVGEADQPDLPVPYARVADARAATGYLAAAFHRHPTRRLRVAGVTGTDGKTTTSTLLHAILARMTGGRAGLISTVSAIIGERQIDTGLHVTTPGAPQIQALLAEMVASGFTHVVLEATSHGLAQGRLNGVDVDVAVLTNVTHEHLDFHGSFEDYRAAKGRLFQMLSASARKEGQPKVSVLNADDPSAAFFAAFPADRVVRYGLDSAAEYRTLGIRYEAGRTAVRVDGPALARAEFETWLAGRFNAANALAALAAAHAGFGADADTIWAGLLDVRAIPGRLERIDEGQPFLALVDFAHTPNALRAALEAARGMVAPGGRVTTVFGCAGLRDRDKRRLMPEAAVRLADVSIFTAEDPRTESLDAILDTMAAAARAAGGVEGETFLREPDRGRALHVACQMARPGDVVIACGKGHEQSMAFGTVEYPWDDREALRAALRGAPLRTLPTA